MLADKSCVFFFNRAYVPMQVTMNYILTKKRATNSRWKICFALSIIAWMKLWNWNFYFFSNHDSNFFNRSSKMLNDQLDFFFVDFAMSVVIRYQDDVKIHNENVRKIITHWKLINVCTKYFNLDNTHFSRALNQCRPRQVI